jgi:SPOR domain
MGRSIETMSWRGIFLSVTAGVLLGCSGAKESGAPPTTTDETLKKYEAGFHPSDYDPDLSRGKRQGNSESDIPDTTMDDSTPASSPELVAGFRVQLLATTSIDEANARKVEAEGIFPGEWIYVEYDPPAYKVRAGNFQSRVDADRFTKLAASRGFQDAWPVPERVYKQPPPLPPHPQPAPDTQK